MLTQFWIEAPFKTLNIGLSHRFRGLYTKEGDLIHVDLKSMSMEDPRVFKLCLEERNTKAQHCGPALPIILMACKDLAIREEAKLHKRTTNF